MKKLILEKRDIKQNVSAIKERTNGAVLYAVLHADGYGAGLTELARILRDEGISRFAVAEPEDAERLRKAGFVEEEILMLRAFVHRKELERLADLNVVYTVGSYNSGVALNSVAEARSTVLEAHIRLDVGMGSGGFLMYDVEKVISLYRYLPGVAFSGVYTQLWGERLFEEAADAQILAFRRVLEQIRDAGYETGMVHMADSCVSFADAHGIRIGSVFLGRGPCGRRDGLRKVGYGEASVEEPRWLPPGHRVGTERPVTLRKPVRVAVVPVGYQNGLGVLRPEKRGFFSCMLRLNKSRVFWLDGQKVKAVGGIGARETMLDVTKIKCSAGDRVTFDLDPLYAKGMMREYR